MQHQTTTDGRSLSRVFHAIDSLTSRAGVSAAVFLTVIVALVAIAIAGFSSNLQYEFTTFAAAITLVMVFVIQHTQNRQVLALQIKLDELLRALPEADNRFVHVEGGSDDELEELETRHVEHHAALREHNDA